MESDKKLILDTLTGLPLKEMSWRDIEDLWHDFYEFSGDPDEFPYNSFYAYYRPLWDATVEELMGEIL